MSILMLSSTYPQGLPAHRKDGLPFAAHILTSPDDEIGQEAREHRAFGGVRSGLVHSSHTVVAVQESPTRRRKIPVPNSKA